MSQKSVSELLQVKGQRRFAVLNAPKTVDSRIGVRKARVAANIADVVLLFVHCQAELDKELPCALASLTSSAIFWLAYPKLTSPLGGDLSRDVIRKLAPSHGLRPVAQIAIDDDWSALRFKLMR